jgi:hypothetical protein
MRPKVLLSALLLAGALVACAAWVAGALRAPPAPTAEAQPAHPPPERLAAVAGAMQDPAPLRISGLSRHGQGWPAASSDSADGILADLEKPGVELHQAALQRARELGDRSIIPRLREMAEGMDEAREKAAILDTIDFLNLPTLAENMAAAQSARAAAGQPDPPQSLTNRWTGKPFVGKE